MDRGALDTTPGGTPVPPDPSVTPPLGDVAAGIPSPPPQAPAPARRHRRSSLALDLTLLGIVGVLLAGAAFAGTQVLYRQFYSPSASPARPSDSIPR